MACLCDETYMRAALAEADLAAAQGEVPGGAVIVCAGEVIARAHNLCITHQSATQHAELLAIEEASRVLGRWRLSDCTLFVTLEPCPMCAGAIINSRIGRVVYAARDPRAGALGSLLNLTAYPLEASPVCESGLLADEALERLRVFFQDLRTATKQP